MRLRPPRYAARIPSALAACLLAACGPASEPLSDEGPDVGPSVAIAPVVAAAPWSAPPLSADRLHPAYVAEWRRAENRSSCALLAFESPDHADQATLRGAYFGGGWGVAYDLPELRSAFGVAGTGTHARGPGIHTDWPHRAEWADGSTAGYGPEGGVGTKLLAYLSIAGQDCLYNVWSWVGIEHLEHLLTELRGVSPE